MKNSSYFKNPFGALSKTLFLLPALSLLLTGCYDDLADPNTEDFAKEIQSSVALPEPNISLKQLKLTYCSNNGKVERPAEYTFSRNTSNWETRIDTSYVIEGVICANDGPFGCLYQMLLVRNIDPVTGEDQAIDIEVKNPCLYPLYPVGQRIRINLKGLYVGAYSRVPRIGYPYYTSAGNHNLGPIPLQIFQEHVQLIGVPDTTVAECQCKNYANEDGDKWIRASENRVATNYPTIATVRGVFLEADGVATLAPDSLEDAGYGVNRTLKLISNNSTMLVRTSTGNECSHIVLPKDTVELSGLFSYDSFDDKWQINLRNPSDFKIIHQ